MQAGEGTHSWDTSSPLPKSCRFGAREGTWEGSSSANRRAPGLGNPFLPCGTGGLWQPLGPHQCPTAGPGPVPGHLRPLRPPGAGPWRVPNGGNSWPGRRQQPRREAWAKCPRFVLTGKLFLRRFHGRDESAAGLSRARCRGRESAAIFPIPCRIPCVFLPPRQPWAAGKEQRAEPGQSSARRSPHPEEFVRRGRAGRNPIPPFPRLGSQRAWASPPWPWPAPRCRTPPQRGSGPPLIPPGRGKRVPQQQIPDISSLSAARKGQPCLAPLRSCK